MNRRKALTINLAVLLTFFMVFFIHYSKNQHTIIPPLIKVSTDNDLQVNPFTKADNTYTSTEMGEKDSDGEIPNRINVDEDEENEAVANGMEYTTEYNAAKSTEKEKESFDSAAIALFDDRGRYKFISFDLRGDDKIQRNFDNYIYDDSEEKYAQYPFQERILNCEHDFTNNESTDLKNGVYPWIVSIYIKNGFSNGFEYICTGALLSSKTVLTAAQCIFDENGVQYNLTYLVLVTGNSVIGKNRNEFEKFYEVNEVLIHENFTYNGGDAMNDLVILYTTEQIEFNMMVIPFCFLKNRIVERIMRRPKVQPKMLQEFTPFWNNSIEIIQMRLKTLTNLQNHTYLTNATSGYGCPCYGCLHVVKVATQTGWSLRGIYSGDRRNNTYRMGDCIKQNFEFTNIGWYYKWINKHL